MRRTLLAELILGDGHGTVGKASVDVVKTKKQADELVKTAFPGAQKVRGIGSQDAQGIRKQWEMEQFKKNDGQVRYRKDHPIDSKTARVYGHDHPKGNAYRSKPHKY